MGCWNETDMISNLHIRAGQKVVMFLLVESTGYYSRCYSTCMFNPCPIPIYGEYDDYGGIEDGHSPFLGKVIENLKKDLLEMPEGENPYHDRAVSKIDFNLDALMQAETDNRLRMIDFRKLHALTASVETQKGKIDLSSTDQAELDRLYVALAQPKNISKPVRKVYIHGDIFDAILKEWYVEQYVDYKTPSKRTYFKDLVDAIPEFITSSQKIIEQLPDSIIAGRLVRSSADTGIVGKFLSYFESSDSPGGIVNVIREAENYIQHKEWEDLALFLEESFKSLWINIFLESTRKHWCITAGAGSQCQDHAGYELLINAMESVLRNEKEDYDDDYDDEEDNS